jgi:hypothetical protein
VAPGDSPAKRVRTGGRCLPVSRVRPEPREAASSGPPRRTGGQHTDQINGKHVGVRRHLARSSLTRLLTKQAGERPDIAVVLFLDRGGPPARGIRIRNAAGSRDCGLVMATLAPAAPSVRRDSASPRTCKLEDTHAFQHATARVLSMQRPPVRAAPPRRNPSALASRLLRTTHCPEDCPHTGKRPPRGLRRSSVCRSTKNSCDVRAARIDPRRRAAHGKRRSQRPCPCLIRNRCRFCVSSDQYSRSLSYQKRPSGRVPGRSRSCHARRARGLARRAGWSGVAASSCCLRSRRFPATSQVDLSVGPVRSSYQWLRLGPAAREVSKQATMQLYEFGPTRSIVNADAQAQGPFGPFTITDRRRTYRPEFREALIPRS